MDKLRVVSERFGGRPVLLVVAAALVCAQGLVAVLLGVLVAVDAFRGRAENLAATEFMAVFGVVAGVGLVFVARALFLRRRWGRAPTLVTQLICVPVAVALVQAQQYVVGVTLGLVAVVAAVSLMSRPVSEALNDPHWTG